MKKLNKPYGDVPLDHRLLAEELVEMETHFLYEKDYTPTVIARALVSLAHDWYVIDMEEKGSELLEKAEKVCPSYFEHQIYMDIEADPSFATLVESLTLNLVTLARDIIRS